MVLGMNDFLKVWDFFTQLTIQVLLWVANRQVWGLFMILKMLSGLILQALYFVDMHI